MCGRYNFGEETEKDVRRIVSETDKKINWSCRGDIHPSEMAIIITGKVSGLFAENMYWGFPSYQARQLMINARSESVLAKKSFSDSVLHRRCVIPAHHFYEWDRSRNKVTFTRKENMTLYMAGFYNHFENEDRFIILTISANESMKPVHDRMPLILSEDEIREWICSETRIRDFLKKGSPMLSRSQEYMQLTLFQGTDI